MSKKKLLNEELKRFNRILEYTFFVDEMEKEGDNPEGNTEDLLLDVTEQEEEVTDVVEPTEEPIDEPTEEPIDEPTEEPVEEPTEEPVEEPTEEGLDVEHEEATNRRRPLPLHECSCRGYRWGNCRGIKAQRWACCCCWL